MKIFGCEAFALCSLLVIEHVTEVTMQLCTSEAASCGKNEVCLEDRCVCQGFQDSETGICLIVKAYGDSCTAGSRNECVTGLTCVSSINKCLCADGSHFTRTTCTSTKILKPTGFISSSQTHNSVYLSWLSPGTNGYINSHVINYNVQGGPVQTHEVYGQNQATTVSNLNPGTTYTFTVVRSITREGRTQTVPASDPYQVTLIQAYGDGCTGGRTEECKTELTCVSSVNKCLCSDGSYYTGTTCISVDNLKPNGLTSSSQTHNSVTLSWTSPDAPGYTNSYVINYSVQGGRVQTHYVNREDQFTTVSGLNSGTTYTFTVVRSITREGRSQTVPASDPYQVATIKGYGDSCTVGSTNKCRTGLVCVSSIDKCLCANGSYYTNPTCTSFDNLKPTGLTSSSQTHNSVRLTWLSLGTSAYTVTSHVINYSVQGGPVQTHEVYGQNQGTLVSNLKPGATYTFTVVRSITREGRTQTVPASDPYQVTLIQAYGDGCTGGRTDECKTELTCVSTVNKCLCSDGSYYTGTTCISVDNLKPNGLTSSSQTHNSVTLSWTSPDAPGYTNSYVINYSVQGGRVQTHYVNRDDQFTTVSGLNSGTTYTFTVVRSITREGRSQTVPASDPYQVATIKGYGDSCTVGSTNKCRTGLVCVSYIDKCLCANGSYYTNPTCTSFDNLKPTGLTSSSQTHNSVRLTWLSLGTSAYTVTSHVINYSVQGGPVQTHEVYGQNQGTLVSNLKPGATYTFTVVRSITREGRTQTVPASDPYQVTLNSCTAVGDSAECGSGLVCVSSSPANKCLCQNGNFYTGVICTSTDSLKPNDLTSSSQTHNSVTLSWKSPDAPGYTNSYVINYSIQGGSTSQTHNVNNQDVFTTVQSLNTGTTYTFTVIRSITREGRTQTVTASDALQAATKLDYAAVCTGDQCGTIQSCIEGKCLCAEGNYYSGDCISTAPLRPSIFNTVAASTSSVTINWNSPRATGYTNSYVIKYVEEGTTVVETSPVSGDASTHIVTGLKAGTSYTFIVVRSITREGRTQTVMESDGSIGVTEKDSISVPVIVGISVAALLLVMVAIVLTVYIKVIRPSSKRQESTQYVPDPAPEEPTYVEIVEENGLSVIQDGKPDVDYYNTKYSSPRSENTYDQLTVYSNERYHAYDEIKDTLT